MSFGMYDKVVELLGRNATLTDRTAVWQDVLAIDKSPVFGAGFESFWLGPRLEAMWAKWWWHPIQAHNGYIETYLNLGWVGVAILVALIIATFRKARRELIHNLDFGRFRLGVLFAIILYNYTEATFKGVHLVWTFFYLIAIDCPAVKPMVSDDDLAEPRRGTPEVDAGFRMGVRCPPAVACVQRRTSLSRVAASELKRPPPSWRRR
jgi:O-antigen ligase